jgi:thioredoxin family protein
MRRALPIVAVALALGVQLDASAGTVPGAQPVAASLRGIPQSGPWLGRPSAPVVLVEYVDLQCPFCAEFSKRTLPPLIRAYVRTGKVRILFRGLAFLGPDSVKALQWTYGAAPQNKLWNVLELLYRQQGRENGGWVTPALLAAVARSVPGLDLVRLRRDAARTGFLIDAAAGAARTDHVPGTPFFQVGRSLATLEPVRLTSFEARVLAAKLDSLLR